MDDQESGRRAGGNETAGNEVFQDQTAKSTCKSLRMWQKRLILSEMVCLTRMQLKIRRSRDTAGPSGGHNSLCFFTFTLLGLKLLISL